MSDPSSRLVAASFSEPRFEIIPMKGVEDQLAWLPPEAVVTITSSPTKGIPATLTLASLLHRSGTVQRVVPHLAARLVTDRQHLADLLAQVADLGLTEVFVVAGDAEEPAGEFEGTVPLLRAMADLGHDLRVGITGYPESHAFIPDDTTIKAMFDKEPYASYIVSQICYDPAAVARWVTAVRSRGTTLPIHLGIPGVVDMARLLRVSKRVGIGDSVRFLRKQWSMLAKLASGYQPDGLIDALAPTLADPELRVSGWHLFTFNEIRRTEQWRQDLLARYARAVT
jgi:methylenetetrahydrofolate reductase (NADPH)